MSEGWPRAEADVFAGIRIVADLNVPLTRVEKDGEEEKTVDVLYWMIDGVICVHPDRMVLFEEMVARANELLVGAAL